MVFKVPSYPTHSKISMYWLSPLVENCMSLPVSTIGVGYHAVVPSYCFPNPGMGETGTKD